MTSSLPGEGKTTTAINLAVTLALAGSRVALVECDLRRPLVANRLRLDGAVGTTSVLVGKIALRRRAPGATSDTGLKVLTSGPIPPNPSELLQSHAMEKLLGDLRTDFDIVIIDAPPLLPVTDAALLAAQTDGAIVVVRHGKTTRDQLSHAIERLEAASTPPPLGVVINHDPARKRALRLRLRVRLRLRLRAEAGRDRQRRVRPETAGRTSTRKTIAAIEPIRWIGLIGEARISSS